MVIMRNSSPYHKDIDKKLKQIDIYNRYPQMRPNVGENYKKKKLLISCESFYFPTCCEEYTNHERYKGYCKPAWWYSNDHTQVEGDNQVDPLTWIDMGTLSLYYHDGRARPFATLGKAIIEAGVWKELKGANPNDEEYQHKALSYCTVMNYFPRPAHQGKSFRPLKADRAPAAKTFWEVVEILQPTAICISSIGSYNNMCWSINMPNIHDLSSVYKKYEQRLVATYHPGPRTWNRAGGEQGRIRFDKFMKRMYG